MIMQGDIAQMLYNNIEGAFIQLPFRNCVPNKIFHEFRIARLFDKSMKSSLLRKVLLIYSFGIPTKQVDTAVVM